METPCVVGLSSDDVKMLVLCGTELVFVSRVKSPAFARCPIQGNLAEVFGARKCWRQGPGDRATASAQQLMT